MSEYHVVVTQIVSEKALLDALKTMGYKPVVHIEAKQLKGYKGDLRKQKANIIIPKAQLNAASNDVGFELIDGKYIMHVSEFDQRCKTFDYERLVVEYNASNLLANLNPSKYTITSRSVNEKKQVKIKVKLIF